MDFAALSAIVGALKLVLDEIRRSPGKRQAGDLRTGLVELSTALALWENAAARTNYAALTWVEARGEGLSARQARSDAKGVLSGAVHSQNVLVEDVRRAFGEPVVMGEGGRVAVEDLLRVYAPEAFSLTPLLADRQRLVADATEELERRYSTGGIGSARQYVGELRRALQELRKFREELDQFISEQLPLSDA